MKVSLGTFEATPEIRERVNKALDSGRLSYGPVTKEYEARFANMHRSRYGVASNSGTSSLIVAIQALKEIYDWPDGSEIIAPSLTFVATINAIFQNRLIPVLVDVDPRSYNINVDLIEEKITSKTKAILPAHLFGLMADMYGVQDIAKKYNLSVIEDSCESLFAKNLGKYPGELSQVACFSTYTAHHLVTGVGGMAITNKPPIAHKMRSLINHGIDLSELPTGEEYDPGFLGRKFRFTSVGHSFRITELEAAIGLAQLDTIGDTLVKRSYNATHLLGGLRYLRDYIQFPHVETGETHSWMVFPIVLKNGSKWPLMGFLNENGVECREMVPLINQPCYKGWWTPSDYPVAQNIDERGLYLPVHQDLSLDQLDYMVETLWRYFVLDVDLGTTKGVYLYE